MPPWRGRNCTLTASLSPSLSVIQGGLDFEEGYGSEDLPFFQDFEKYLGKCDRISEGTAAGMSLAEKRNRYK